MKHRRGTILFGFESAPGPGEILWRSVLLTGRRPVSIPTGGQLRRAALGAVPDFDQPQTPVLDHGTGGPAAYPVAGQPPFIQ
jgi:hypothetical protein